MGQLADIARCRHTTETDAKTENESAAQKHTVVSGRRLDAGPYDDNKRPNKHACSTTEAVIRGAREKDCGD